MILKFAFNTSIIRKLIFIYIIIYIIYFFIYIVNKILLLKK